MKIKKLILKNFRSYENFDIDFQDDINVIIGRNDVGKSTILEALEIFFNNDLVKIDYDDVNVKSIDKIMSIGVVFEIDKSKQYLVDSEVKIYLQDEYLLNQDGFLEIHKIWDCSKEKLTASSLTTVLRANYLKAYSDEPLITYKIADLRKELDKYKKEIENFESVKKNISSIIRHAIYENVSDKELTMIDIPLDKDEGKKLFENLKNADFPLYFLFQADRANKDSDKEVQDPLKAITKKAIAEVENDLKLITEKIEEKAKQIGYETLAKLKEMAPQIASILKPNISNRAWDSLFSFSFDGDDGIPINKRGSGVRRLILLNYFRAEAERNNALGKNVIYAIEEPETSQHPDYQSMLIKALIELSNKQDHQIILTTHTPEIAKMVKKENLILIIREDGELRLIDGEEKLLRISTTLGLLPYYSKVVVCLEGEHDINFLWNINQGIEEFKSIIDLEKEKISLIPMQGANLKSWINKHYLSGSNVIEFHLYDRDNNREYEKAIEKVNNRNDKSKGLLTQKREMENYIHYSIIEKFFNIKCDSIKANWSNEDVPIYVTNKVKNLKENDIKGILNGKLTKSITKKHLEELNAYEEIKSWFLQIKELYYNQ
jgi:putative ATP-dependent endonuclease of OLD family